MWFDEEYGQDTIYCNDELGLYVNEEVFDIEDKELKALILGKYIDIDKSQFVKRKATEVGHIFQNEQVYSKIMKGTFVNREGKQDYYYNGCYGIGVSRLVAIIAVNCIRKYGKLIWEDNVSAFNVNIICKNDEKCLTVGQELYEELKQKGIKVCLDDRNNSIGEKLKDNELFGVCKIIIIGNGYLNNGTFEVENRKTNEKFEIDRTNVDKNL